MKFTNAWIGLMGCALVSASFSADAGIITQGFIWAGEAGYTVEGGISYDGAIPIVSGFGVGPTTGIQDLTVSFYDPGHNLLFSVVDVSGGVSSYDYLSFTFDTLQQQIVGDLNGMFDLGRNSFPGDLYIAGAIGGASDIFDFDTNSLDSIANGTVLSVIPEPSTLALFAIGLAGLASRERKTAL